MGVRYAKYQRYITLGFLCELLSTINRVSEMYGGSDGQRWKMVFTHKG